MSVTARIEPLVIPTYPVGQPEKNPVFFEKRVYQGSSGKVYPVPFIDKVFDNPIDTTYQSALLENEFVRLVMLPEIGGRIFIGQDKTNDDYDFFYRQDVIKPALVGLAGPWISGGVEFNWPQHHRPGTFLPADVHIEEEPDGARTVWLSEHDPINRLKGMHGVRLRPDSSLIELRVRLYNRTPITHTFLWWANVAAKVHDKYQSFFPTDVHYVADHAVRATSSFPEANNHYYDIPYQDRPGANDLSWYKNIPVPTSYMVCQTDFNFFGGYDFSADGGFVHVANRHIAPGKKQWTWGNDAFGWAWDRELTDENGPYIELMAGVFTDNQPDFTYLHPYETKTFSQFWWPIQDIGPVQQANRIAALACTLGDDHALALGLCVSETITNARLMVDNSGAPLGEFTLTLSPGESWQNTQLVLPSESQAGLSVRLLSGDGDELLSYQAVDTANLTRDRAVATEPAAPEDITSTDELFFTGEHLDQYRHPTRDPELYWNACLKRDPGDARCHLALGKRAHNRGELPSALDHFQQAINRFTRRHPNPVSGEAHYYLGITLRKLGKTEQAYAALYKATWDYAWRACAYYQLATIDCLRHDWPTALEHLDASLDTNRQNNKAVILKALALQQTGAETPSDPLTGLLRTDPLDHWAKHVLEYVTDVTIPSENRFLTTTRNDAQTILDLVFDYAEAGFYQHAIDLLDLHHRSDIQSVAVPNPMERSAMTHYALAWLKSITGAADASDALATAHTQSPDHFFPSRLEEVMILEEAVASPPAATACYALGNYYFDQRRHADAIEVWEKAVAAETTIPQVFRNLGIAYWNHLSDGEKAAESYRRAIELDPTDARLVSESDQLAAKRNRPVAERLTFLENHLDLVHQRDDATIGLASLYNLAGKPDHALELVMSRRFHPWEGGEGAVLCQYTTAHILLGRQALDHGDATTAHDHFSHAMDTPESLGEAYHPLQAKADVNYWLGRALNDLGRHDEAKKHFQLSAEETGDFSAMAVTDHSPLSYYRGLSLQELGHTDQASHLFDDLRSFAEKGLQSPAGIDYFATSLPNLLVFNEDMQSRADAENHLLIAMASHGQSDHQKTRTHLNHVHEFCCDNQHACSLSEST
ncbi:MAG: DUF5107 domain-containing protein [Verrucomicrobiae bacterium]|nr:DUF5107 domain-containing protein [Verrucomicrobiae bacterium]NNJ42479.1 DUF5107 domain-containing protein [Akkermansiaceae bacterium]